MGQPKCRKPILAGKLVTLSTRLAILQTAAYLVASGFFSFGVLLTHWNSMMENVKFEAVTF